MSSPVEYKIRAEVAPSAGQQLELAPCEVAMAKVSLFLKANMRPTIVSIIEGGCPSADAFTSAAEKLAERHPILKYKFIQTSPEPTTVESTLAVEYDETLQVPVHYHEVSISSSSYDDINVAWKSVWSDKIEKTPLALNECIARIDVVSLIDATTTATKTAILFTCEHAFSDGMSLSTVAHELLSLLTGDASKLAPSDDTALSAPLEILCAPTSEEQGKQRLASFMAFPRYTDMARFPPKNSSALPRQLSDTCHTFTTHAELNEAETAELVSLCKTHNCTVTSIVGVAMMQASAISLVALNASGSTQIEGVTGQEAKVVLSCAADTRRLLTPPLSPSVLACHVSGVAPFLQILDATRLDRDFLWSVAAEYRKHLTAVIAGEYPLFIAPFLHSAWAAPLTQQTAELKPLNSSISNWGISPVQKEYGDVSIAGGASFRVLSVMPICTLSAFPFPGYLVNTAVGKLTVTCHTPSGPDGLEDSLNVTLVKDVMRILRSLLSTA